MNGIDIIRTAVAGTLRSKLRTTLTVLAIFIGAFTLTVTSAIGTGVSSYIDTQIGAFGATDVLSITKTAEDAPPAGEGPAEYDPDQAVDGGDFLGESPFGTPALTAHDLDRIGAVDGVLDVSAVQQLTPRYVEFEGNGKYVLTVNANASMTTPDLAAGEQLEGAGDELQILLVTSYLENLGFADADAAVGETVTIGVGTLLGEIQEVQATVVGVMNASILASGAAVNSALADELYRVQNTGQPAGGSEGSFEATAHFDPASSEEQVEALKAELADRGYTANTMADQIGIVQAIIDGIIGVLNAFAIIALIAASFGIINTLLMSVQERTREIGLMKAMGMGGGRIYALFSTEAVFIGFLGSIFGALAAYGVGMIANGVLAGGILAELEGLQVLRFEVIPVGTIILGVMAIAFLAGTLPARRAARQNPIEALRYE
ncbi:MAG: FtsX-like permease family protein [Homoserinimonas sp.]